MNKDKYDIVDCDPTFKSYITCEDVEELIPWETLASCFDYSNHKLITYLGGDKKEHKEVCFKTWVRKCIEMDDRPGYYINKNFGWEEVWKPLKSYISGSSNSYIPNEWIIKEEDLKNEVEEAKL